MIEQIDKYKIISRISEGASGVIYLVEADQKQFALKLMKSADLAAMVRFRRESAALARLHHPNLVRIFNVGEYKEAPYFVMEYIEGESVESAISKTKFSSEEAVNLMKGVTSALFELHKINLIHRDLKPANILIAKDKICRLIDFGLVGDVEQIKSETALVGTPMYCSPEQSRTLKRDVDFRSDLYSLGTILFQLLIGRPPFTGTISEILEKHASTVPVDVREIDQGIRPALALITKKLLAKDPDDRYQTCSALLFDLDRLDEVDRLVAKKLDPSLGTHNSSVSHKVQFVRRDRELGELGDLWKRVEQGEPGMVIVTGPSGSGKTRLCDEFLNSSLGVSEDSEYLVLKGKCQLFDRDLPFNALRESINSWVEDLNQYSNETRAKFIDRIREAGRGRVASLARFSAPLMKFLDLPTNKNHSSQNAEADREVFFDEISGFFLDLGRHWKGITLFVDDLQWLDDSSLQLIEAIFSNKDKKTFLLLGTAREDQESKPRLDAVKERMSLYVSKEIKVNPFTREELADLVERFLGTAKKVEPMIVDQIFLRAQGSPFVSIEILRTCTDQGLIRLLDGAWKLEVDGLEKLALSENVYSLIVKRSEKLPEQTRSLLQFASLYGGIFIARDIASVAGIDFEDGSSVLGPCEELGLIERQGPHKYKFIHDKVQESLITSIPVDQARTMSDALAKFFYSKERRSDEETFACARLFAKGELALNHELAIASNSAAGEIALENFAFNEAYGYYKFAYELVRKFALESKYELDLVPRLATCATVVGDWVLAREASDRFIQLAGTEEQKQESLILKVWALKTKGDYTEAWGYFQKASEALKLDYPFYFHWLVLNTIFCWFRVAVLDIFYSIIKMPENHSDANSRKIEKLADLFVDAQWCAEMQAKRLDYLYLTLRILLIGFTKRRYRELALGYAWLGHVYGTNGLLNLSKIYYYKMDLALKGFTDKFIIASCKQRQADAYFFSGLSRTYEDARADILGEWEKLLLPVQIGYVSTVRAANLGVQGLSKEALEVLGELAASVAKGKTVLSEIYKLLAMGHKWLNLSALGLAKQALEAKSDALQSSSKDQYNQYTSPMVLFIELWIKRYLEGVDTDTEELLAAYYGYSVYLWDQNSANIKVQTVFNYLYLLERSEDSGKRLSLRRDFNRVMRVVAWRLYTPGYRAGYYYLRARYHRNLGSDQVAMFYLEKAERLASKYNQFRYLFDVLREKAHLYKKQGNATMMLVNLASATTLATEHGWLPTLERMRAEGFGPEFERLIENVFSRSPDHAADRTVQSTVLGGATLVSSALRTSVGSSRTSLGTQMGVGTTGIEEMRFTNALLEVSQAFVKSSNPHEQSKLVLLQIIKLFAAQRGVIFIENAGSKKLEMLAAQSVGGEDIKQLTGFSGTVVDKVFRSGEPLVVTGTEQGEALASESAVLHNLRSIMATPLKIAGQVFGVVYLDSSLAKGLFGKSDLELFSTLASHIAIAYELTRMAKIEAEKASLAQQLHFQEALAAESRKVVTLVDNMRQALFSVDQNGVIVEPVSKFSNSVFGFEIVGKSLFETIYKGISGNLEDRARVESALTTVFGEGGLQWELAESDFPRKVTFKERAGNPDPSSQSGDKVLRVVPAPVWDKQEMLEKILFVVEDATLVENLEREIAIQTRSTAMLQELVGGGSKNLASFLRNVRQDLDKLISAAGANWNREVLNAGLRDLHTIKGNARRQGLKTLSAQVHAAETALVHLKESGNLPEESRELFISQSVEIETVLGQYSDVHAKFFGAEKADLANPNDSSAVSALIKTVADLVPRLPSADAAKVGLALQRLKFKSVLEMARDFESMVTEISRELGKEVRLVVEGDALLSEGRLKLLQAALLHLIRNSIDHGIELPAAREKASKDRQGTIRIQCTEDPEFINIVVADDGRGIDVDRVWRKALEKGLAARLSGREPSDDQKINFIFEPGFTTQEAVTDISGRGIGLDAVKENIESMNGSLSVQSALGQGVQFVLKIPQGEITRLPISG